MFPILQFGLGLAGGGSAGLNWGHSCSCRHPGAQLGLVWAAQDGLTAMWVWKLAGLLARTLQAAFHAEMQRASPSEEAMFVVFYAHLAPASHMAKPRSLCGR